MSRSTSVKAQGDSGGDIHSAVVVVVASIIRMINDHIIPNRPGDKCSLLFLVVVALNDWGHEQSSKKKKKKCPTLETLLTL